jgi:hypothetical protein
MKRATDRRTNRVRIARSRSQTLSAPASSTLRMSDIGSSGRPRLSAAAAVQTRTTVAFESVLRPFPF